MANWRQPRLIAIAAILAIMVAAGIAAIVHSAVTGGGLAGHTGAPGPADPGATAAAPRPANGTHGDTVANSGCPATDRPAHVSHRPGARKRLVPDGEVSLTVCRYRGMNAPRGGAEYQLIGAGRTTDIATVRTLASALDALKPAVQNFMCPMGDGRAVVAYFRYPSGVAAPVSVGTDGCQEITNGHIHRLGLGASLVGKLIGLTRPVRTRVATFSGRVELCGGLAPGRCRTSGYTVCTPRCRRSDRVAASLNGVYLGQARLHRGRFRLNVAAPGRFTLTLMAVNRAVARERATAVLGRTIRVTFTIPIK